MADTAPLIEYRRQLRQAVDAVNLDDVFDIARRLRVVRQRKGTVYVLGNGGSSANAQHLVLHLRNRGHAAVDMLGDLAWLTADANDYDYGLAPVHWLQNMPNGQEHAVFVISGSGMSENVLAALAKAKEHRMMTLGLLGFGGGQARALCDASVTLPMEQYGPLEDVHSAVVHMVHEMLHPDIPW